MLDLFKHRSAKWNIQCLLIILFDLAEMLMKGRYIRPMD